MSDQTTAGSGASGGDLEFVLGAFLSAYRPILERELEHSASVATLVRAARENPPTAEQEIEQARALFERFFTP